jgi:hypothetical protein
MDIDEGDNLAAMVRISAEEVETAAKAREQALAEEAEENPVIQTETEVIENQEEDDASDIEEDAENSAD